MLHSSYLAVKIWTCCKRSYTLLSTLRVEHPSVRKSLATTLSLDSIQRCVDSSINIYIFFSHSSEFCHVNRRKISPRSRVLFRNGCFTSVSLNASSRAVVLLPSVANWDMIYIWMCAFVSSSSIKISLLPRSFFFFSDKYHLPQFSASLSSLIKYSQYVVFKSISTFHHIPNRILRTHHRQSHHTRPLSPTIVSGLLRTLLTSPH